MAYGCDFVSSKTLFGKNRDKFSKNLSNRLFDLKAFVETSAFKYKDEMKEAKAPTIFAVTKIYFQG